MRVLCDGKKKPKKRVYKFLNQFTVIYIYISKFYNKRVPPYKSASDAN